jgi:hypothetical protein
LGYNEPGITVGDDLIIYEEGDGAEDFTSALPKIMKDTGLIDGATLLIDDFSQDLSVHLILKHQSTEVFDEEKTPDMFTVQAEAPKADTAVGTNGTEGDKIAPAASNGNRKDDDIELVVDAPVAKIKRAWAETGYGDDVEIVDVSQTKKTKNERTTQ